MQVNGMKTKVILTLISIIVFLMSCKEHVVTPEPVSQEPLIPLKLGNYWLYQRIYLNPDGTEKHTTLQWKFGFIIDDTVTRVINGESILNYKLFICDTTLKPWYNKPGNFEGSKLIYQNSKGLFYTGTEKYDTIRASFNDLLFPYTAIKGDSFTAHLFYYNISGNLFSLPDETIVPYLCVSTDSLFETPIGNFRCVVYKSPYWDVEPLFRDDVYYFIKPGLGLVGMVTKVYRYPTQDYVYFDKSVLIDYKIE